MSETSLPQRLAGRVIVIDPDGRTLLFYYDDPPPKGQHWTTPGGGVEEGEDFYAAACREVAEETGWTDVAVGPEEVFVESNVQWSHRISGVLRQTDRYFIGRVAEGGRALGDVAAMHEDDEIRGHRWWTLAELDATAEAVYPRGLAELVRAAIA